MGFIYTMVGSHPQIDGQVNDHQMSKDLLFRRIGDDYTPVGVKIAESAKRNVTLQRRASSTCILHRISLC